MAAIALIGDFRASVIAHRAIPIALNCARSESRVDLTWRWIASRELLDPAHELSAFDALWIAPGSPYENPTGVLDAIRWARETKRPLLGTCGGFQHVLLEFARNVLDLPQAEHAETHPAAHVLVVTRLACSLVEKSDTLCLAGGSRLRAIYAADSVVEGYHCNYGPAPAYRAAFEHAGLRFTACDAAGEPRAAELDHSLHPFFIGTLFQPERAALQGKTPPVVRAFVQAAFAPRT